MQAQPVPAKPVLQGRLALDRQMVRLASVLAALLVFPGLLVRDLEVADLGSWLCVPC
jgi:hypothetical protein